MTGQRALIVDDEPTVRMTLRYAIDEKCYSVSEVESAEAALSLPNEPSFDLFVLDKNLPGISGVDLAKQLRLRDRSPTILLVTGYATVDSAVEAMNAGADGYLEKPFDDISKISERITDMFALAAKRRANPAKAHEQAKRIIVAGAQDCALIARAAAGCGSDLVVQSVATPAALAGATFQADIVFVDDTIGDFDLLASLVAQVPKVVAVKARPTVEDVDRCMRLGVAGFLPKPLQPALVDELIARLVN